MQNNSEQASLLGALRNNPKEGKILGLCVAVAFVGLIVMIIAESGWLSTLGLYITLLAPGIGLSSCMKILASARFGGQKILDDFNPMSANSYLNDARLSMFIGDKAQAKADLVKALGQNPHNQAAQHLYSIVDISSFNRWLQQQSVKERA